MASVDHNKIWSPIFTTERRFGEDQPYVEALKEIYADGDYLERLLQEYEGGVPSCMSEEIGDYCQNTGTALLGTKPDKAKAWLNDIEYSTLRSRSYPHRLTAHQLYTLLNLKRFEVNKLSNADRRLVYVPDLEPKDIRVLMETASYHQIDALRDTIWKHLALKTSIRLKLTSMGFQTFRLEFHIPYSALRGTTLFGAHQVGSAPTNILRNWKDVSFLRIPPTKIFDQVAYRVHDAHISLAICGSDHSRWTCWSFSDTNFKSNAEDIPDIDDSNEDPIASDSDGIEVQSNDPILDPREYFLRTMDFRMKQVKQEWMYLTRKVEKSVEKYIQDHPAALSQNVVQDNLQEFNENLQWVVQANELIGHLLPRVSQYHRVWERFDAEGGDICYFSDLRSESRISRPYHSIRESFEELQDIEHILIRLSETCKQYHSRLLEISNLESHKLNRSNHKVSLETSQAALANQRTSQLALSMNLFFTPVALAIALFGTQEETLKFKRSLKSLVLCALGSIFAVHLFVCINSLVRRPSWLKRLKNVLGGFIPSYNSDPMVTVDDGIGLDQFSGAAQHISHDTV